MPKFTRVDGDGWDWGAETNGAVFRFRKVSRSLWQCRAYFDGDQIDTRASSRLEGFLELDQSIRFNRWQAGIPTPGK